MRRRRRLRKNDLERTSSRRVTTPACHRRKNDLERTSAEVRARPTSKTTTPARHRRKNDIYVPPRVWGSQVDQGSLGDCWLLAAFASAAEFPGVVRRAFLTTEANWRGKYVVTLWDGNARHWLKIVVDDRIPCRRGTTTPVFCKPAGRELWVLLLEKAFAKFVGGYPNLAGGFSIWALQALTGDDAYTLSRDAKAAKPWRGARVRLARTLFVEPADPSSGRGAAVSVLRSPQPVPAASRRCSVRLARFRPRGSGRGAAASVRTASPRSGRGAAASVCLSWPRRLGSDRVPVASRFRPRRRRLGAPVLFPRPTPTARPPPEHDVQPRYRVDMKHAPTEENKRAVRWVHHLGADGETERFDDEKLFGMVLHYDKLGFVMNASTCFSGRKDGLVGGHAYSLMAAVESGSHKLVKLRNPWGSYEWTGEWSDASKAWGAHPKVARACGVDPGKPSDDGVFWMSYGDFLNYFDSIDVLKRSEDLHDIYLDTHEDMNPRMLGPCRGCLVGCACYCVACKGARKLCCGRAPTGDDTVDVEQKRAVCCFAPKGAKKPSGDDAA